MERLWASRLIPRLSLFRWTVGAPIWKARLRQRPEKMAFIPPFASIPIFLGHSMGVCGLPTFLNLAVAQGAIGLGHRKLGTVGENGFLSCAIFSISTVKGITVFKNVGGYFAGKFAIVSWWIRFLVCAIEKNGTRISVGNSISPKNPKSCSSVRFRKKRCRNDSAPG